MSKMIAITVVAGKDEPTNPLSKERAKAVGTMVAELGCNLITGGGPGSMAHVARAFCETPNRAGRSIGVIPGSANLAAVTHLGEVGKLTYAAKKDYPNPWIEIPIFTHLGGGDPKGKDSRNILNVASADILVALAGGRGTQAELELALALDKLKHVFVLLEDGERIGAYAADTLPKSQKLLHVSEPTALASALRGVVEAFLKA
jgi:predicted Rossmann-fold nucleotide-binding protein